MGQLYSCFTFLLSKANDSWNQKFNPLLPGHYEVLIINEVRREHTFEFSCYDRFIATMAAILHNFHIHQLTIWLLIPPNKNWCLFPHPLNMG